MFRWHHLEDNKSCDDTEFQWGWPNLDGIHYIRWKNLLEIMNYVSDVNIHDPFSHFDLECFARRNSSVHISEIGDDGNILVAAIYFRIFSQWKVTN